MTLARIAQARDIVDDLCVNGVPARVLNGRFVISEQAHIAHVEVKCVYTAKVRAPMRSHICSSDALVVARRICGSHVRVRSARILLRSVIKWREFGCGALIQCHL